MQIGRWEIRWWSSSYWGFHNYRAIPHHPYRWEIDLGRFMFARRAKK